MNLQKIILEYFRRQERKETIYFDQPVCFLNTHWTDCSDVLDAVSYALFGNYVDSASKMRYSGRHGFYRVVLYFVEKGKEYQLTRYKPVGEKKGSFPYEICLMTKQEGATPERYFDQEARCKIHSICGSKKSFFEQIILGRREKNVINFTTIQKEIYLRPFLGTGRYFTFFKDLANDAKNLHRQYGLLIKEQREKIQQAYSYSMNSIAPVLLEDKVCEGYIFELAGKTKKIIDSLTGLLTRITEELNVFRSRICKIKEKSNPSYYANQIRYARYMKSDIMHLRGIERQIQMYSHALSIQERRENLTQILEIIRNNLHFFESFSLDIAKEIRRVDKTVNSPRAHPFSCNTVDSFYEMISRNYDDPEKISKIKKIVGQEAFSIMNSLAFNEEKYGDYQAPLQPWINGKMKKGNEDCQRRAIECQMKYNNERDFPRPVTHLISSFEDSLRTQEIILNFIFENDCSSPLEYHKFAVKMFKNVGQYFDASVRQENLFLEKINSEIQSLVSFWKDAQTRIYQQYKNLSEQAKGLKINQLSKQILKEKICSFNQEFKALLSRIELELSKKDTSESLLKAFKESGSFSEKWLSFLESIEQKIKDELCRQRQIYFKLGTWYRDFKAINNDINDVRQRYSVALEKLSNYVGTRKYLQAFHRQTNINPEIEKQRLLLKEIFREANKYIEYITGRQIRLTLDKPRSKNYVPNLDFYFTYKNETRHPIMVLPHAVQGVVEFALVLALIHYSVRNQTEFCCHTLFLDEAFTNIPKQQMDKIAKLILEEKNVIFIGLPANESWAKICVKPFVDTDMEKDKDKEEKEENQKNEKNKKSC